ncbi:MAG: hypothetical protein J0M11_01510 [Anaerolineae bacterium]|nr:hypothetical protein [Anaerolineae bacterium]
MTTLNDLNKTDGFDHVMAAHVNNLIAASFRSEYQNVETLAATRPLLDVDTPIQRFDCNGAARIVKLPLVDTDENHPFLIKNETVLANYNLTIQNNGGSTTYCVLPRGEFALIFPDGSGDWVVLNRIFTRPLTTGQITANQNDWFPSAAEYSDVIRVYSDAARDITGFGFPAQGKTFLLINHGSYTITLKNESASSVAANRLAINADFELKSNASVLFYYDGASSRWRVVGGAVGGLTNSASSVTTSNVTGVAGRRHILDVSGMTANRNFVLPAGVAGQEIEVNISVGDDTYALILIGDTGISINGGSAATEWSRLFITNETVRFVATSSSNWNVINDGRIPCIAVLERQAAQSIANTTATKIAFDAAPTNRGNMGDIATNDRVNIRRSNFYVVSGFASIGSVLDNQEFLEAELYKNGSLFKFKRDYVATASSNLFASPEAIARGTYSAGDYFELYIYHNEGASQNTDTTYYPTLAVIEQL